MVENAVHRSARHRAGGALLHATRLGLCLVVALGGCGGDDSSGAPTPSSGSTTTSPDVTASSDDPPPLEDGPIGPGRYRFVLRPECADDLLDCAAGGSSAPPLGIDVTVPDEGWEASLEFLLISPSIPAGTGAPDGGALVLGWTTAWVGLNSDPCIPIGQPGGHKDPDITVGPTVDDFVQAVQAHPAIEITEPSDVRLGDHEGRFFTLTAPTDLSGCDNWRPWDPGFYAQGPDNVWDVWVMDVDGFRVLIVAHHFPGTTDKVRTQLREMAESIRFAPVSAG